MNVINNVFSRIVNIRAVDWGVLYWGCKGLPIGAFSSPHFVADYAALKLKGIECTDDAFIAVTELVFCSDISEDTLDILDNLCTLYDIDLNDAKEKWFLCGLDFFLEQRTSDPLYGLLELNEFWFDWGLEAVENTPNMIQSVNSGLSPEAFYTMENYERVVTQHKTWLNDKLAYLKRSC